MVAYRAHNPMMKVRLLLSQQFKFIEMSMIIDGEFALPSSLLGSSAKQGNVDKAFMLSYINALEGYKTKFKNLHWSAEHDALHLRVDEFSYALGSYQDAVSEDIQGTLGVFSPSELKGTEISTNDAMGTIKLLLKDTLAFRRKVDGKEDYYGLVGVIDDFLHTLKKYIYLFRMC